MFNFDIMSKRQDEIRKILLDNDLSQAWLARRLNMSAQNLSYHLNESPELDADLYKAMKEKLTPISFTISHGPSTSEIIAYSLKPGKSLAKESSSDVLIAAHYLKFNLFPIVSIVRAGAPNGIHDDDIIDNVSFNYPAKDGVLAVLVEGDSMADELHHGDIVLVDKNVEVQNGNIVIAIFENETHTIKRYRELTESLVELYPVNKSFPSIITEFSKIRAIYKVVRSLRNH